MIFNMTRTLSTTLAILVGLAFTSSSIAQDQDAAASLAKAHEQFQEVLDNTDDLFYKTKKGNDGSTFYSIMWENGDDSVRFIASLKKLGFYNGVDIYAISCWTLVAGGENPFPPAVIKAVATTNDRVTLGSFSCSADFKKVYANLSASLEGLTPGTMWLYAAYLNNNAVAIKEIIDEATSASGR